MSTETEPSASLFVSLWIPNLQTVKMVLTYPEIYHYVLIWFGLNTTAYVPKYYILDPRSQRAGSYKIGAVIVNV